MLPIPDRRFRIQFAKLTRGFGGGRFEFFVIRRRNTNKNQPRCILSGRKGLLVSILILIATGGEKRKIKIHASHHCLVVRESREICKGPNYFACRPTPFLHNMYMTRKLAQLQDKTTNITCMLNPFALRLFFVWLHNTRQKRSNVVK